MATTPVTSTTSPKFSINWKDLGKGLLLAVLTPVIAIIYQSIQAGSLVFNWGTIGLAALAGGVAYLMKNFLSPAAIVVDAPPATVQAVKDGTQKVAVLDASALPFSSKASTKTSSKP